MKTLPYYKSLYRKAKTHRGKTNAMNSAMLNLSHEDKQKFFTFTLKENQQ